jgi:hypothetical protein
MKIFVLKELSTFKPGQIVDVDIELKEGVQVDEVIFGKDSYIPLNESLSPKDEERVKEIIRDVLKKVFWRIYTRNSFILQ